MAALEHTSVVDGQVGVEVTRKTRSEVGTVMVTETTCFWQVFKLKSCEVAGRVRVEGRKAPSREGLKLEKRGDLLGGRGEGGLKFELKMIQLKDWAPLRWPTK